MRAHSRRVRREPEVGGDFRRGSLVHDHLSENLSLVLLQSREGPTNAAARPRKIVEGFLDLPLRRFRVSAFGNRPAAHLVDDCVRQRTISPGDWVLGGGAFAERLEIANEHVLYEFFAVGSRMQASLREGDEGLAFVEQRIRERRHARILVRSDCVRQRFSLHGSLRVKPLRSPQARSSMIFGHGGPSSAQCLR